MSDMKDDSPVERVIDLVSSDRSVSLHVIESRKHPPSGLTAGLYTR